MAHHRSASREIKRPLPVRAIQAQLPDEPAVKDVVAYINTLPRR
jgi:hypothetical protein